jgi:phytoene synthase
MDAMNKKTLEHAHNHAECARLARPIGSGFRYACLTLAEPQLHAITALKALDVTLADITHTISEPKVAHTKLDWWRGALHEAIAQNTAVHPILAALLASLDAPTLKKLVPHIEARLGSALLELDYQGFETSADLSAYLDARGGAQFALYCALLPVDPALEQPLRTLGALQHRLHCLQFIGRDRSHGFIYLPAERMAAHQLSDADLHRPNAAKLFAPLLQQELADLNHEYEKTVTALRQHNRYPPKFFRALIALDRAHIRLLQRHKVDVISLRPERAPIAELITAWWAAKRPIPPAR